MVAGLLVTSVGLELWNLGVGGFCGFGFRALAFSDFEVRVLCF